MSDKLLFKIVIEDNGKQVYAQTLSYETMSSIVSNYEDDARSNDFFSLAAKHPASTVRENVACKDKISEEIVTELINDTSISVLRNLVRSDAFKEHASHDVVEKLVKFDHEIAQNVAGDIESYQQVNATKLLAVLVALPDPSISYSLAGNYNAPKKVLKELLNHSDPYVASEARRRLDD